MILLVDTQWIGVSWLQTSLQPNFVLFFIIDIDSRNLNAKKKSKEKVIEIEEPKEIVNVGDDEEEDGQEDDVNDEMIFARR